MIKKLGSKLLLFLICTTMYNCIKSSIVMAEKPVQNMVSFKEIWAYVVRGEEKEILGPEPITDIGCFSASINSLGRITSSIKKPETNIKGPIPRFHLVISELNNTALIHFCLEEGSQTRKNLISDIVTVSQDFDGVQIDFESISPVDAQFFFSFLSELKINLKNKTLSVAVPARTKDSNDAYQYSILNQIVDRIVIMAYDQHWSTSNPGPVASLAWCESIASYAVTVINKEKLIMGLPLYGRAWQEKNHHRAYKYTTIQELIKEKKVEKGNTEDNDLFVIYDENVKIYLYYDDMNSLMQKLQLYKNKNIQSISFWRIGYGPSELWENISVE